MEFTQEDFNETAKLAELTTKIDSIDADYVNSVSDDIFKRQPFFLAVLLGHRFDVSETELEEIMKIYFLIWDYFKLNNKIPTKKITEQNFVKVQNRHVQMLKYGEGEPKEKDKMNVYANDLQNLKSKSLLAAILYRFKNRPVLINMGEEKKSFILIGIKSSIECFETL